MIKSVIFVTAAPRELGGFFAITVLLAYSLLFWEFLEKSKAFFVQYFGGISYYS